MASPEPLTEGADCDTIQITIVDRHRMAVSPNSRIAGLFDLLDFGAGIVSPT